MNKLIYLLCALAFWLGTLSAHGQTARTHTKASTPKGADTKTPPTPKPVQKPAVVKRVPGPGV